MICSVIVSIFNNIDVSLRCLDLLLINFDFINNFELIIINDGSNEIDSNKLNLWFETNGNNFNIKLINNETNKGVYYSWNCGIEHALSEYVCIMHSDCYLTPNTIERLLSCLKSDYFISNNIMFAIPSSNNKYNVSSDYKYFSFCDRNKVFYNLNLIKNNNFDLVMLSDGYIKIINNHANVIYSKHKDDISILYNLPTYCFMFNKEMLLNNKFNEQMYPAYFGEGILFNQLVLNNILIAYCYGIHIYHLFGSTIRYNNINRIDIMNKNSDNYCSIIESMNNNNLIL